MLVKLKADKRAFLLYRRDKRRAAAAGAVHDCEFTPPPFSSRQELDVVTS